MKKKWITFDLDGTLMQNPFVGHVFPEIERRILLENDKLENVIGQLVTMHETRSTNGRTAAATSVETEPSGPTTSRRDEPRITYASVGSSSA